MVGNDDSPIWCTACARYTLRNRLHICVDAPPEHDPVNHPSHYTMGAIEAIDAIEAWQLNYHRGNAVKYIARAGRKGDEIEDLSKAAFYLNREIERLTKAKAK